MYPIAGNGKPGRNNEKSSSFSQPAGLCIFDNLIFVCDAGNACIQIIAVSSINKHRNHRGKVDGNVRVEESTDQTETDDEIPVPGKSTVTYSLTLLNSSETFNSRDRLTYVAVSFRKVCQNCSLLISNKE